MFWHFSTQPRARCMEFILPQIYIGNDHFFIVFDKLFEISLVFSKIYFLSYIYKDVFLKKKNYFALLFNMKDVILLSSFHTCLVNLLRHPPLLGFHGQCSTVKFGPRPFMHSQLEIAGKHIDLSVNHFKSPNVRYNMYERK